MGAIPRIANVRRIAGAANQRSNPGIVFYYLLFHYRIFIMYKYLFNLYNTYLDALDSKRDLLVIDKSF